jgi:hypothetical protein
MDYLNKIDLIIEKIQKIGKIETVAELTAIKDKAFTSTELLASITHKLISLTQNDKQIQDIVENDVLELQKYCFSIGIHISHSN